MDSVFGILGELQRGEGVRHLSMRLGAEETATRDALSSALPLLIGALARNASHRDGARRLSAALDRDHDGSVLGDLPALAGEARGGEGILRHVFGARQAEVAERLGRGSGLDATTASRLLAALAPLVMGALGRTRRAQRLDDTSLARVLDEERRRAERAAPGGYGLLAQLLDADRDGDTRDDVARFGFGLLRRLFGRRP